MGLGSGGFPWRLQEILSRKVLLVAQAPRSWCRCVRPLSNACSAGLVALVCFAP